MAEALSASMPSLREGEKPTTFGMPAIRACQASDPPIAPRPMTAIDDGRTDQYPLEDVTEPIHQPG